MEIPIAIFIAKGVRAYYAEEKNGTDLRSHAWSSCLDGEPLQAPRLSSCRAVGLVPVDLAYA